MIGRHTFLIDHFKNRGGMPDGKFQQTNQFPVDDDALVGFAGSSCSFRSRL
jgi:hypothetical protein